MNHIIAKICNIFMTNNVGDIIRHELLETVIYKPYLVLNSYFVHF